MTEVTRVPLQPIRKGSLLKLWLGVVAILLAAGALAWEAVPHGVKVKELTAGVGASPTPTDWVLVNYTGKLDDGKVFDQGQQVPMHLSEVVPGFRDGVVQMKKGGKYEVRIPAQLAYGATPPAGSPIPANADLTFEIELLDFITNEDFEQRMLQQQQMMQQLQQMQGQHGGAPQGGQGAPPAPGPQVPAQ